jgi:large subunit ribosomal protein L16
MFFIPKKSKFKKQQKGKSPNRINGSSSQQYQLNMGSVGLKSLTADRITSKQLEALRQTTSKLVKKAGRVIINAFPSTPVSKKPIEVRMGKGKGNVDHWVFKIKPGFVLCEIITDKRDIATVALETAQKKLSVQTKIIFN